MHEQIYEQALARHLLEDAKIFTFRSTLPIHRGEVSGCIHNVLLRTSLVTNSMQASPLTSDKLCTPSFIRRGCMANCCMMAPLAAVQTLASSTSGYRPFGVHFIAAACSHTPAHPHSRVAGHMWHQIIPQKGSSNAATAVPLGLVQPPVAATHPPEVPVFLILHRRHCLPDMQLYLIQ